LVEPDEVEEKIVVFDDELVDSLEALQAGEIYEEVVVSKDEGSIDLLQSLEPRKRRKVGKFDGNGIADNNAALESHHIGRRGNREPAITDQVFAEETSEFTHAFTGKAEQPINAGSPVLTGVFRGAIVDIVLTESAIESGETFAGEITQIVVEAFSTILADRRGTPGHLTGVVEVLAVVSFPGPLAFAGIAVDLVSTESVVLAGVGLTVVNVLFTDIPLEALGAFTEIAGVWDIDAGPPILTGVLFGAGNTFYAARVRGVLTIRGSNISGRGCLRFHCDVFYHFRLGIRIGRLAWVGCGIRRVGSLRFGAVWDRGPIVRDMNIFDDVVAAGIGDGLHRLTTTDEQNNHSCESRT
tara:strand:+ start:1463 stop:2524 length:1062 start_codon:yes stop_codon:yes gene_type:complete